ncbi:MAG: (Fe-S)-binding protein [Methanobacteriota archaeon]
MANLMDVYKNLPQTNCKKCREETCMSFASKLIKGDVKLSGCAPLNEEGFKEKRKALEKLTEKAGNALESGHVMDYDLCNGCGNCVVVCPVTPAECSSGGKDPESEDIVFKVVDGKIQMQNIQKCKRLGDDRNCTLCKDACPFGVIDLV